MGFELALVCPHLSALGWRRLKPSSHVCQRSLLAASPTRFDPVSSIVFVSLPVAMLSCPICRVHFDLLSGWIVVAAACQEGELSIASHSYSFV